MIPIAENELPLTLPSLGICSFRAVRVAMVCSSSGDNAVNIPKNCATCRHLRRDLLPDVPYACGHPDRIWQDLVPVDGWPLEHDINTGIWSECPFRRREAGGAFWNYLVLPNRHVVVFHRSNLSAMATYEASALRIIAQKYPPMLSSGTFLDGDLAGYTYDLLK